MNTIFLIFGTLTGFALLCLFLGHGIGAGQLSTRDPVRICLALVLGLAVLILNITLVNLWLPLNLTASLICLWPVAGLASHRPFRLAAFEDAKDLFRLRGGLVAFFSFILVFSILAPLVFQNDIITFDGTPNHDSFFWVTAAHHLQLHSYLTAPETDPLHPVMASVPAITGWKPIWGRMGGEGLLAFWSSLTGSSPVFMLLPLSASLLLAWNACCYLFFRTFFGDRLPRRSVPVIILIQPVFLFAHYNSNLPNLLGSIFGTISIVSLEQFLKCKRGRWTWAMLLVLSIHGMICSYPEIVPFIVFPAGLLWIRFLIVSKDIHKWTRSVASVLLALIGLVLNPASSYRAYYGFIESFSAGRADAHWANMFEPLNPAEFIPGLLTMNPWYSRSLGWGFGLILTGLFVYGFVKAFRNAKDATGAFLATTGGLLLLAYTIATGFSYGWQKSIQFSGPMISTWVFAAVQSLIFFKLDRVFVKQWPEKIKSAVSVGTTVMLVCFLLLSMWSFIKRGWEISHVKGLSKDYFQVADYYDTLKRSEKLLVIKPGTFDSPFYHSMWGPFFFSKFKVAFTSRYPDAGGYNSFERTITDETEDAGAFVVSRAWADIWETNAHRLWQGKQLVLLENSNILHDLEGFYPLWGVSKYMNTVSSFEITPCSDCAFSIELKKSDKEEPVSRSWSIKITDVNTRQELVQEIITENRKSPWLLKIPLKGGIRQRVSISTDVLPKIEPVPPFPFVIKNLNMELSGIQGL